MLVDEGGLPVVARGEVQNPDGGGRSFPFDCTLSAPSSGCRGNVVVAGSETRSPLAVPQVRFVQSDGSFTPWQPARIEVSKSTDTSTDDAECPCTSSDIAAADIVVPVTARLSAQAAPGGG
jgi:hypothetical protein